MGTNRPGDLEPSYIASGEIPDLAPEVRDHDPAAALDGGADGLDAYREIVALAAARMKLGGWLVFEIGHDQKEAVCRIAAGGRILRYRNGARSWR
ncbi:MAG: hypothetical protein R3C00_00955 [Hyphomonas sp.]